MDFRIAKESMAKALSTLNDVGRFPQFAEFGEIDPIASMVNFLVVITRIRQLMDEAEINVLRQFDEANDKWRATDRRH